MLQSCSGLPAHGSLAWLSCSLPVTQRSSGDGQTPVLVPAHCSAWAQHSRVAWRILGLTLQRVQPLGDGGCARGAAASTPPSASCEVEGLLDGASLCALLFRALPAQRPSRARGPAEPWYLGRGYWGLLEPPHRSRALISTQDFIPLLPSPSLQGLYATGGVPTLAELWLHAGWLSTLCANPALFEIKRI